MRISDWSSDVCSSDLSNAARLDGFTLHAGDAQGVLSGSRLDEVASLTIGGLVFQPGELNTPGGNDQLTMVSADTQAAAMLKPDSSAGAKATLKDGRVVRDRKRTRLNSRH